MACSITSSSSRARGTGSIPAQIRPSPDTFTLEAYNGRTGAFMWRYDYLGWNMNMGVWWTPFITGDFDGDGKIRPKWR